jgi:hypothetical protein
VLVHARSRTQRASDAETLLRAGLKGEVTTQPMPFRCGPGRLGLSIV